MPPDVREWLPEEHLAWFVIDAVGEDTAAFYAAYRADGQGRAAYELAMMIALLRYCWSRGVRSSRVIAGACFEDVACRVIAAQQRFDHATIALCADAGSATVGIDGTKVAANANRDRTMDYEQYAKASIEEQIVTDAAQDEPYGLESGDELPPELARSKGRQA